MNTTPTTPLNANWYRIHYSAAAPAGLPPVIQAARVLRYSDNEGTWLVALWDKPSPDDAISSCILRVRDDHVMTVSRHADMGTAAREFLYDAAARRHAIKPSPSD